MVTGTKFYEVTKQKKKRKKKEKQLLYKIKSPLELLLTSIPDGEEYTRHMFVVPG